MLKAEHILVKLSPLNTFLSLSRVKGACQNLRGFSTYQLKAFGLGPSPSTKSRNKPTPSKTDQKSTL